MVETGGRVYRVYSLVEQWWRLVVEYTEYTEYTAQ